MYTGLFKNSRKRSFHYV